MNGLRRLREARRRDALRGSGVDSQLSRPFVEQAQAALQGADLHAVPVGSSVVITVSDSSPRPFVLGLDPLGGPNPLGG